MTFSGDLADISLADVFQNISSNRLSGTLIVSVAGGKRYIYFAKGLVAGYSLGVNRGLAISEHLVNRQYVTAEDMKRAIKRKARLKCTLRESMAAANLMAEEDFRAAVGELVEECLYDLLALKDAEFVFEEGKPTPRVFDREQKMASIAVDSSVILMEGARREDEISRIHQVVTTDRDIFVMVEGWAEYELEEMQIEVAELLDGHTEVSTVLERLPHSRFDVLKTINDLVRIDLARPLSGRELEEMAHEAIADDRADDAVVLLSRALMTERSNTDMRSMLVDLLERSGRTDDAAMELAILGYQAAQRGDTSNALEFYERAAGLKPSDIGIQEKRVELLRTQGGADFETAILEYVDQLMAAGLGEKARAILEGVDARARTVGTDRRLAEIDTHLGDYVAAANLYMVLAKRVPRTDDQARLTFLREASSLLPDDETLREQVEDLETGRARNRRRRRRVALTAGVAATVLLGVGTMGVVEITASHAVIQSLHDRLEQIAAGEPAAVLSDLERVQTDYSWTIAGRQASTLRIKLFELQVQNFERLMADGETREALAGLEELAARTTRDDARKRLDALVLRANVEIEAEELFELVNGPQPRDSHCREFVALTAPELLDFHLDRLDRGEGVYPRARQCLLQVLRQMDSPRSLSVVSRVFLRSEDPLVMELAQEILETAPRHRAEGRESNWADVYPALEEATEDPVTGERARQVLVWLRGDR